MLTKEWIFEWLELYVKASTKERTYLKYRRQAERHILPYLGERDVDALSPMELQRFSLRLLNGGLSAGSINFIVAILRSSLKKGASLGVIKRQYSSLIVRAKPREKKISCFSVDEQKKIERFILSKGQPNLVGILLCLYTGLRIGELLALTWEDVDWKNGTVCVNKSCHDSWVNGRYVKRIDSTKTPSSERVIPLPKQILKLLKIQERFAFSQYLVPGRSEYGAQIRSYQRTFQTVLRRLKIAPRGFHTLRHTFATRALEVGMDVKTLSEILGHRDPSITLRRYAHSLIEHKRDMMNRVGKLLE